MGVDDGLFALPSWGQRVYNLCPGFFKGVVDL